MYPPTVPPEPAPPPVKTSVVAPTALTVCTPLFRGLLLPATITGMPTSKPAVDAMVSEVLPPAYATPEITNPVGAPLPARVTDPSEPSEAVTDGLVQIPAEHVGVTGGSE
jgi:hypothetical protein